MADPVASKKRQELTTAPDQLNTFKDLDSQVFQSPGSESAVRVDYDLWYPFQWYVRDEADQGTLQFSCFKKEGEDGWNAGCNPISEAPDASALVLSANHTADDGEPLAEFEQSGPLPGD